MSPGAGFRQVLLVAVESVVDLAHDLRGSQLGVTVVRAADEALSLVARGGIDCVVLHQSLPLADRLELRRALEERGLPVVVARQSSTLDRAKVLVAQILGLVCGPEVTRVSLLPERTASGRPNLVSKTILVVDDDPDMLRALKRTLAKLRSTVLTAETAARALELLAAVSIDLVVSDYSLGTGETGLDLLAFVRSKEPRTRRVLLTGHTEDGEELRGDRTAADRILPKPFEPEELHQTCLSLLGKS